MSRQPKSKVGATPGKLALVAVLAVVLVAVVASNWPGDPSTPDEVAASVPPSKRAPRTASNASATTAANGTGPFKEFAEDGHWPEFPMSEVVSFDPLAKPIWARPAVADEGDLQSDTQINELLAAKNAIIFMSGQNRMARIGDNDYHVGDVIGRFRISDITSQGVVLSENQ